MALRLDAEWMAKVDDRLLEYLESEGPRSPSKIAEDERIRFGRSYINLRLRKLELTGFVQNIGNGVYSITEQGEQYLSGEFDARDLEKPDS